MFQLGTEKRPNQESCRDGFMSQEPIKMVKETIKHYEDSQSRLEAEILSLQEKTRVAEKNLFDVKNIKQKFEASLECLEEAKEFEAKEEEKSEGGGE